MGRLKKAEGAERAAIQAEIDEIKAGPMKLKAQIQELDARIGELTPELDRLLLEIPMPPDDDVPDGVGAEDNVEISRWGPDGWDWDASFEQQRGFRPRTHIELCESLGLVDFPRGVKIAGSRSYTLTGRACGCTRRCCATRSTMIDRNGFTPMSVPVIVREERDGGHRVLPARARSGVPDRGDDPRRGHDLYLTGTGEVGLMGLHQDEILDEADLPIRYVTVTCFRREAGAAGKDTAGLYRIHQFDKVEQVVICRADEAESRAWHQKMMGFVVDLLQDLELPYRLLQCCTGDLGPKNADMIDIECWMPGRGDVDADGVPVGEFGETHSASRLYDFQCRRLNMRYRAGGDAGKGATTFCHSLNNTVAASPRILIPILEMHQNADGSVTVPEPLRAHMGGVERLHPR
jgi:seryl-tRNA synthetase